MVFDHRRILATAMGRLRAKMKYRPVVFELMPPEFTLLELQRTVEALSGIRLHKQNFRRLVEAQGLVEGTGRLSRKAGGRPAEQFRFRRAVVRAHNYMTPEIFHCVADFVGDSLQLAREAAKTDAKIIVQAGVHFMAETAKILSPQKTVLIPDRQAGCSLAASVTAADVRLLRQRYPGLPVITYVNTSAEVKAESDICCTSSNAVDVVEFIAAERDVDTVIMIPDEYLAQNVAKQTAVKIITWKGHCEVHERFSARDIDGLRAANPGLVVLAHPECPPEVVEAADYAG